MEIKYGTGWDQIRIPRKEARREAGVRFGERRERRENGKMFTSLTAPTQPCGTVKYGAEICIPSAGRNCWSSRRQEAETECKSRSRAFQSSSHQSRVLLGCHTNQLVD